MKLVAVEYQFQLRKTKNHFTPLFTQSNFWTSGFNALMTIIRTGYLFIKVRWVSYLKQPQNHSLQKKDDDYKGKNHKTIREVGDEWFINKMNAKPPPLNREGDREKRRKSNKTNQGKAN